MSDKDPNKSPDLSRYEFSISRLLGNVAAAVVGTALIFLLLEYGVGCM